MGSKCHGLLQPTATRDRDLAGQAVAVDGTAWPHQFLKVTLACPAGPGGRLVLVDKTYRLINHLRGFLYRTLHLLQRRIWPVYVFDGACDAKGRNALTRERLHEKHLAARKLHGEAIQAGAVPGHRPDPVERRARDDGQARSRRERPACPMPAEQPRHPIGERPATFRFSPPKRI